MTKHSIAKFCALVAGVLVIPTVSWAGTETAGKESKAVVEKAKESFITGDLGVNVVSEYISRGLVLENQGVIAQPYVDLYFKLYEGDGFLSKVSLNLGLWSSVHSHSQAIPGSTTRNWYEFDYTAGLAFTFAKKLTATLSYFEFDSPSDSFNTARSINLNLAYDDSDLLGAFAIHPHFTVLAELTAPGFAGLDSHGWYFEFGIAPGFAAGPATITFPINVGFGDDNFYAGDNFGYVSAGVNASVPLKFIPEGFGSWSVNAGYTYYYLGDNLTAFSSATQGNGEHSQHVFQGGIGLTF